MVGEQARPGARGQAVAGTHGTRYRRLRMIQSGEGHEPTTSFGFEEVPETAKARLVRGIFDRVAPHYDLMNDLMSFGIHRLWKQALLRAIEPRPGETLADVAGGTGDVAAGFLVMAGGEEAGAHALLCDVNETMVQVARDRAIDSGLLRGLSHVVGDAENLPLPNRAVDVYAIAFGLRNVTRIDAALAEARRILKPGGRFFCLEFSHVVLPVLDRLYDAYSFTVLPALGGLVTGDAPAYRYLAESIRRFPAQEELARRIATAGLDLVKVTNLSGGIAAIHSAWRV